MNMKYKRFVRETGENLDITKEKALSLIAGWYLKPEELLGQLERGEIDFISGPASNITVVGGVYYE